MAIAVQTLLRSQLSSISLLGKVRCPMRWPDGTFSVRGAAAALGVTTQTVFDYLARGLLAGHQLTKGQPWQVELTDEQMTRLRARVRHTKRSKKEAS
jgi:hypothetical protein